MMLLLAIGIGLGAMGLIAIAIAIPIVDSSLGNGLLISGVTVTCTGFLLAGLGLAVRDLKKAFAAAPLREVDMRPAAAKAKVSVNPLFPPQPGQGGQAGQADAVAPPPAKAEPPLRAGDMAAPEIVAPPAPPAVEPPPAPPQPERPARRNLLFSIKRRDKTEQVVDSAPVPKTALESEPAVSFDNAWPQSPRAELEPRRAEAAPDIRPGAEAMPGEPAADGLTVVKSGVVDGMSYTLFSDGSIEARLPGEDPIRFGSLDALRTYLDERQ